ncbi:MAG: tetratricopeptide repeat protein, partial [Thermoanaerobaculia bacterium]
PDLKAVAEEAGVDWIVTGSVLRAGEQLRVNSQLVEAATGSVLWSGSLDAPVTDIFQIQDDLTGRIVASLKTPLNEREQRNLHHDVPASALGYELFLRANQQGHGTSEWLIARDLYLRALDEDPGFAPAYARLGRIQWLLAKYTGEGEDNWTLAEKSLRRALELNPDHAPAHRIFAELETDLGRAPDALDRLLERLRVRPNDPELYAALLKVLRYCGLLEESLAADRRGRELDPKIGSSVVHTYIQLGRYEEALHFEDRRGDIGYVDPLILGLLGEEARALRSIRDSLSHQTDSRLRAYLESLRAGIERNPEGVRIAAQKLRTVRDPEALYYTARALIHAGEIAEGLDFLEKAIPGFSSVPMIERDPWLEPVRADSRFQRLLEAAKARQKSAADRVRHSSFI